MANQTVTKKILYAADGKTIAEIDYVGTNGKNVEIDKYSGGQIQTATTYAADGKTVVELDTYAYTGGKLASVTMTAPGQSTAQTAYYNANGSLKEIDLTQRDKTGALIETDHYSPSGLLMESDLFSGGKLKSMLQFDASGHLVTGVNYGTDGKTVLETDTYKYNPGSPYPVSETRADGFGKVLEVNQFDSYGHLISVTHPASGTSPSVTPPSVTAPATAPVGSKPATPSIPVTSTTPPAAPASSGNSAAWTARGGYGDADLLKALTAVLGKAPADVAVPSSAQSFWEIGAMHFQDAWAAGYTGKGVVVADIDTGIDLKNADLARNLSSTNWNFINNTSNVQDDNGHGTCTASEICAANDGKGLTGGAYDATLMVLKALDAKGSGTDTNIVAAINYAVSHGANVINLSLGSVQPDPSLQTALKNAASHGVIVCMAAGNDGGATPSYPAAYAQGISDCIAVGAVKQSGSGVSLASFSNQAGTSTPYNFVDAPGQNIPGYSLNGVIMNWSGTSMAAPLVAAEIADLLSAHLSLTPEQIVQDVIHATVTLIGV